MIKAFSDFGLYTILSYNLREMGIINSEEKFHRFVNNQSNKIINTCQNKMNINKNTIISLVIILITVAIGGYLLMTKKDNIFNKNATTALIDSVQLKF